LVNGVEHRQRIGARIEEARVIGTADYEKQVNGVFRNRLVSLAPFISAGDPAADADAGLLVK
jgi:hypothetical protein